MPGARQFLDIGTWVVIITTLGLFIAALYVNGFGHGLLLEAGVFLISVKLIMMAYKNSVAAQEVQDRLSRMEATLTRIEGQSAGERQAGVAPRSDDTAHAGGRRH